MLEMVFSQRCYSEFVENNNFGDKECLHHAVFAMLGLLVMALCTILKIPQITKVIRSGSTKGINFSSVFIELFCVTVAGSYPYLCGFPFSAWGESLLMCLQQCILTILVLHDVSSKKALVAFIVIYPTIIAAIIMKLVPVYVVWFINAGNLPIILFGKIIQFKTNYTSKSTGQLSAMTFFLNTLVCLIRLFTSIILTADAVMILQCLVSGVCNALILLQIVFIYKPVETIKFKRKTHI